MSARMFATLLLFVLSEAVGVALGEWFFQLFLKAVPPVALSDFNTQSSRIAHWMYGGGVGVVLFIWALLGMVVGKIGRSSSKAVDKA
ncbi:MAG TPA: hypothetical protein VFQ05_03635 [Candidatus Eisenbacteria bacterium]|nr:hypothetical protein [Candidatus Eisenbacteria bacterium]